jgi:hypothetical protein
VISQKGNEEKFEKIQQKALNKNKILNSLTNVTHGCLCSSLVDGYAMGLFLF